MDLLELKKLLGILKNIPLFSYAEPSKIMTGRVERNGCCPYFRKAAESSNKHVKYQFWQNQYHPIELSSNKMQDQRLHYLHNNPVEAGIVDKPEYYIYSSARDYGMEKGLLDICFIQ